jgi:hypothetical protein
VPAAFPALTETEMVGENAWPVAELSPPEGLTLDVGALAAPVAAALGALMPSLIVGAPAVAVAAALPALGLTGAPP